MAKKSVNQRQSRLSNPVVATKMYEALARISTMQSAEEFDEALSLANEALGFARSKEEVTDMQSKKKEVVPECKELVCEPLPTRYSVRLGVKIPSHVEQYRNMEANVSVIDNDPEKALEEARQQFIKAVVTVCNTMGETPPDEIRPSVEEIYEANDAAAIYGEGD